MIFKYTLTYFNCQNCQSRIHCRQCSDKVYELLKDIPGVKVKEANLEQKCLVVEMDGGSEETVLDTLENGYFFAE